MQQSYYFRKPVLKKSFWHLSQILYYILFLIYTSPLFSETYRLICSQHNKITNLSFIQDNQVIAEFSASQKQSGFCSLQKKIYQKPISIQLSENKIYLKFDQNSKSKLHIIFSPSLIHFAKATFDADLDVDAQNQNLLFGKTDKTFNSLNLNVKQIKQMGTINCDNLTLTGTDLKNYGTIFCDGNCTFKSHSRTGTFHNYDKASIIAKENLVLACKTISNIGGTLQAGQNIDIKADLFFNGQPRLSLFKNQKWLNYYDYDDKLGWLDKLCHEYINKEKYSIAHKIADNITIQASTAKNKAGIIQANSTLKLSCKTLNNLSHYLDNIICKKTSKIIGPKKFDILMPNNYGQYHQALIAAGDKLELTIGQNYNLIKSHQKIENKLIPGLTNTGYIGSINLLFKTDNIRAHLNNGITDIKQILPKIPDYKPKPISLNIKNLDKEPAIFKNNKEFLYTHIFQNETELPSFTQRAFAFIQNINKDCALFDKYKQFFYSPQLEQSALISKLNKIAGISLIPEYNNHQEQLNGLRENGLWLALVNGSLYQIKQLAQTNQEDQNISELSLEESEILKTIIQEFAIGKPKIDIKELHKRKLLVQSGTHAAMLDVDQIKRSPVSCIYYKLASHKWGRSWMPYVFLAKKDFIESFHPEGLINTDKLNIDGKNLIILNTGSIHYKEANIHAKTVRNQKLISTTYGISFIQKSGDIIGLTITLEADTLENNGALISGTKGTNILVKGTIANMAIKPYTKTCDLASCASLLGQNFAHSFLPGTIISSQGPLTIISQAEAIINEASNIIAHDTVTLQSKLDNVIDTLIETYRLYDPKTGNYKDIPIVGRGTVQSLAGDINLVAQRKNMGKGPLLKAANNIYYKSKQDNDFTPAQTKLEEKQHTNNVGVFSAATDQSTIQSDYIVQPEMIAKDVVLQSELNNVLEAVIIQSGKAIHLIAAADNIIKGAQQETSITSDGYTFGISFVGLDAAKSLAHTEFKQAVWELASQDPLVVALEQLINASNNADRTAAGIYTGIGALRAFIDASKIKKNGGAIGTLVANRLGFANTQGNFDPTLTFKLGYHHAQTNIKEDKGSSFNCLQFVAKSGRTTHMSGNSNIKAQDAKLEQKEFIQQAGRRSVSQQTNNAEIGISFAPATAAVGGSVQYGSGTSTSTTYHNSKIASNNIEITAEVIRQEGGIIEGQKTKVQADTLISITPSNQQYSDQMGWSAAASTTGMFSGSFTSNSDNNRATSESSGISGGQNVDIDIQDDIILEGAFISGKGQVKAFSINGRDVHSSQEGTGGQIGVAINPTDSIPVILDIAQHNNQKESVTHANISPEIIINTQQTTNMHRDLKQAPIITKSENSYTRYVTPIINIKRFKQDLHDIRQALFTKKPLSMQSTIENLDDFQKEEQNIQTQETTQPENSDNDFSITDDDDPLQSTESVQEQTESAQPELLNTNIELGQADQETISLNILQATPEQQSANQETHEQTIQETFIHQEQTQSGTRITASNGAGTALSVEVNQEGKERIALLASQAVQETKLYLQEGQGLILQDKVFVPVPITNSFEYLSDIGELLTGAILTILPYGPQIKDMIKSNPVVQKIFFSKFWSIAKSTKFIEYTKHAGQWIQTKATASLKNLKKLVTHTINKLNEQKNKLTRITSSQHHNNFINLVSPERTNHILFGDKTGGGHLWPGKEGKSIFPKTWSSEKIMHYVSDIATDPTTSPTWTKGTTGSLLTKSGKPARYYVDGIREGITIRVVIEPLTSNIITAFPIK